MVVLEILSPMPLTRREDGQIIFELWKKHLTELLPDLYGNWEPIDLTFNALHIDHVLNRWKWPFLSVKSRPIVDASVWMRKGAKQRLHATLIFRIEPRSVAQTQLIEFVQAASLHLKADFSCLHLLTDRELAQGRINGSVTALDKQGRKLRFFIASRDLQQRIPELYWVTVLGAPYVKMLGKDRLLSAPTFRATAVSSEAVLLQLTENLTDVEEKPNLFEEIRSQARNYIGESYFFDPNNGEQGDYLAPKFLFFDEAGQTI